MPTVTYYGGKCSHRKEAVTDAQIADGRLTCEGDDYTVKEGTKGVYLAILSSAVEADTVEIGEGPAHSRAPGAWRGLTAALGKDLQGGLHRAEAARKRIVRLR